MPSFISPKRYKVIFLVAGQIYEVGGGDKEYIIHGNDVLMKCNIPSFVSDFVSVTGWVDSEGSQYLMTNNYGK